MGLLDQIIGNVLGGALGGGHGPRDDPRGGPQGGGGLDGGLGGALGGGAMSPIVQAILMLLLSRGGGALGDVLGNVLGGGRRPEPQDAGPDRGPEEVQPGPGGPFGDIFGRRQEGGRGDQSDFSDLAGGLDPPGGRNTGTGPYAGLNHEPGDQAPGRESDAALEDGGLGGLLERFRRGGHGDVLESWIGSGENRPIAPAQLADALGADTVDALSRRTGLGRDALLSGLAQALPGVVDALTPHGRLPSAEERRAW
jgi:uncharacterized protein YidB (DUF937 family)